MGSESKRKVKPDSTIGQALIREGVITEEQLERALRTQQLLEELQQLGQVLFGLGYASRKAVDDALSKYGANMRLGELLVEQGHITQETLEAALQAQKERNLKLGQALLEIGAINERTLQLNIARQAGVPFIEPNINMIDKDLLRGVSPDYLMRYPFLPFMREKMGALR